MELLCCYEIGITGYSTAKKTESGGIAEIGSYCSCLSDPITFTVTLDICYHFILFLVGI